MGKSVDLPDPLESGSPQPLGNADDLLAQMAGEEVDRLLAQADADGARRPETRPAPPPAAPTEPVAPIGPEPFTALRSKLPDDVNVDEVMAAILGDVSSNVLARATNSALVTAEPTTVPAPSPAPAQAAEFATGAAERQALTHLGSTDERPGPGELEALTGPIDADDDGPLPVYLKPLEWMNAPLDLLPSTFRDVLGQAAILTLVNAIAVLIYVFVFRDR